MKSTENESAPDKPQEQAGLAPATCSADGLATDLTELTNKYIELGLSPEQAASVFAHAADSALSCLKWEPTKTRIAHDSIQKAVILLESHWMPKPPNTEVSSPSVNNQQPEN
jgi:hypothetical protein